MGKLIVVSGKNDSGKSVFAEKLVAKYNGKRYYIATMIPKTDDNYQRIEKHKKQREGLGFITLELPYSLSDSDIESESIVLLEDVANLLANNIFDKNIGIDAVISDMLCMVNKCTVLVAVMITGLEYGEYDEDTKMYITRLDEIYKRLCDKADAVITMKNGKPVYEKGDIYDIN